MIRKPKLHELAVGDLGVDPQAQRDYKDKDAQKIADNYDPEKLGVFKVSRRTTEGGQFIADFVIDGQHRRGALRKLGRGHEKVPCLVYTGLTLEEEALIFLSDNADNRTPTPIDIYRLSLVAQEPTLCAIQGVLQAHGLSVENHQGAHSVSAVGALRWLFDKGGSDLLDRTLTLVEAAWGQGNRDARDGNLLKGVGKVLADTTGARLDLVSLADKLSKEGKPGALIGTARTHRLATKNSQWLQIALVIVGVYNKNRSSGRIEL